VLFATGREPELGGLGLEGWGSSSGAGHVPVDEYSQTRVPSVSPSAT
jgi:pyruvate/2-oxoglutarate dehydrogenase complex dihydrolipoamide dehydrogenase (E3) component